MTALMVATAIATIILNGPRCTPEIHTVKTVSINKNHQNAFVNLSILSFKSMDFSGALQYLQEAERLGYTPPEEYVKSLEPYKKK